MSDACIREALKQGILRDDCVNPNVRVVEELGLDHGTSRIDIAVIRANQLIGYEIKSGKDTLSRLPHQVHQYGMVFDKLSLVVDYRHAYGATKIIPPWWGVYFVEASEDDIVKELSLARLPSTNPSIDKNAIVRLLWKYEALQFLEEMGIARGVRSKSRSAIYACIVDNVDIESLRSRVCDALRNREYWRVGALRPTYVY